MPASQSLVGKTAVVTGASRGIGSAIALELASRGANVLVHYSSSPEAAATVVSKIQALGVKSSSVKSDLGSKTCGNEIVDAAVAFSETGKIDILVLNGAVARNMVLEEITMDTIDEHYTSQMDVNVRSTILIVSAAAKYLSRGSRIVLLSSVSARGGYPSQTVYGGTKAMLEHFSRVWSKELGHKYGTTVNCVNPGPVATDMWFSTSEKFRASIGLENTPAEGRVGEPDDIAQVVAFLCEEGSRWVTGSTVCANGGMLPN